MSLCHELKGRRLFGNGLGKKLFRSLRYPSSGGSHHKVLFLWTFIVSCICLFNALFAISNRASRETSPFPFLTFFSSSAGDLANTTLTFSIMGSFFDAPKVPGALEHMGRGIVIAASGKVQRQYIGAYVTSYIIRKVHMSMLPIEICYSGKEEAVDPEMIQKFESLGNVRMIDITQHLEELPSRSMFRYSRTLHLRPKDPKILQSYASKPYAMFASSFRETILFDAGAIPFIDPVLLFDFESYKNDGFMMFRDYVRINQKRWSFLEEEFSGNLLSELTEYYKGLEGDSSCVVYDKFANWTPLMVTLAMNGPMQKTTYAKLIGDKDTWSIGMFHSGKELAPLQTTPGFFFMDYHHNSTARKVLGQIQGITYPASSNRSLAIYFNNQLFNFTKWPHVQPFLYMGFYDKYQEIYQPGTFLPDCTDYDIAGLTPLPLSIIKAFDGVSAALQSAELQHCVCRDDWAPDPCKAPSY